VVADERMGVSIVSGDQLMRVFGESLNARLAVFAADVDGVFDRPPAEEGAVLLTEVAPDTAVSFGEVGSDVTGALKGKLEWMRRMADAGIETWMVNGRVPERLPELASTGSTVGTRIVAGGAGR
jgi:isopentenyl phosphate kinase